MSMRRFRSRTQGLELIVEPNLVDVFHVVQSKSYRGLPRSYTAAVSFSKPFRLQTVLWDSHGFLGLRCRCLVGHFSMGACPASM